jgi:uncharacterized membrane protein HdeD (DUF308 family)
VSDTRTTPVPEGLARLGDHWGLVVGYGVVTILIGLVLAIWPGETLVVLAVLLSIQLMVNGIFSLINAFAAHTVDGGVRALLGLTGALSIIVALLCLRAPLQTVVVIGLLIGAWLVISGLIEVFTAVLSDSREKGWRMFMGIVSVAAGAFLLVNPELSLSALVIVMAVWLFGYGAIALVAGLRLRSLRTAATAATA